MLENNAIIKVQNRSRSSVGYDIKDLRISRIYEAGEIKEITMEELRKLSYQPGGMVLIRDYLKVGDTEAQKELLGEVEFEYNFTDKDVDNILLTGNYDSFLDCLDFAPKGVLEAIKKRAVELRINSVDKRDAIRRVLGFDVTKAIEIENEVKMAEAEMRKKETADRSTGPSSGRRVAVPTDAEKPETTTPAPRRRAATPASAAKAL